MDLMLKHNDLQINSGDFSICTTDTEAIAQAIAIRLKIIQGEWFMDASLGIPYFTEIFGQKRNERFIRQVVLPEIQSVLGVREITSFTTHEHSDRTLTISFEAVLTDGTVHAFSESVRL
jgi:hypothetical protein